MNFDLQTALKYTTDTVKTLLAELQKPEHNEHRWGTDQSKTLRGMLADALRDAAEGHTDAAQIQDLNKQADLLQNPEQHIVVREGKVRAGRFTVEHINALLHQRSALKSQVAEYDHGNPATLSLIPTKKMPDRAMLSRLHIPAEFKGSLRDMGRRLKHYYSNSLQWISPTEEQVQQHNELLDQIENAPYEEVDAKHPSERPQQ